MSSDREKSPSTLLGCHLFDGNAKKERNRLAAAKFRKKKKQYVLQLEKSRDSLLRKYYDLQQNEERQSVELNNLKQICSICFNVLNRHGLMETVEMELSNQMSTQTAQSGSERDSPTALPSCFSQYKLGTTIVSTSPDSKLATYQSLPNIQSKTPYSLLGSAMTAPSLPTPTPPEPYIEDDEQHKMRQVLSAAALSTGELPRYQQLNKLMTASQTVSTQRSLDQPNSFFQQPIHTHSASTSGYQLLNSTATDARWQLPEVYNTTQVEPMLPLRDKIQQARNLQAWKVEQGQADTQLDVPPADMLVGRGQFSMPMSAFELPRQWQ